LASAEEVAEALGYDFLRRGNFLTSANALDDSDGETQAVALSLAEQIPTPEREAFGGLLVEAVGFEVGVDNPSVYIYLTRGTNKAIRSLPKEVSGVKVSIQKMGPISIRPDSASSVTNVGHIFERHGRVCCGSSCGPTSEASTGTLGALVRKKGSKQPFLLSNNHVFGGCNHVPKGQPILAPSAADGRPGVRAPGEIGRHDAICELRSGSPNFVTPCDMDIALALATNEAVLSSWQGDKSGYDTPTSAIAPASQMKVQKYGRTTGHTTGVVEVRVTVPKRIGYSARYFKGEVWFTDIWTIRSDNADPFALPGDSGSLVANEDASAAVGVLFAASRTGEYAWIVPIQQVLGTFGGLQLLGNHGV
jgi:hypothetical protein